MQQTRSAREWGKYPPEHVVRFVARTFYRVPNRSAVRLLEIGCGPGANVWFMAREGFRVSGIDCSPTAIRKARERLANEGLSADLRVGDNAVLPWPDNTFDGVLENVSLYCNGSQSIRAALAEVRRVLKPGAPFQSSFFTTSTWGYGTGTTMEPDAFRDVTEGPVSHPRAFDGAVSGFRERLGRAGFVDRGEREAPGRAVCDYLPQWRQIGHQNTESNCRG
jgi:SAM-dependent methyltransferase